MIKNIFLRISLGIVFKSKRCRVLIVVFATVLPLFAQLKLPKLVSDGMILQRDVKLTIWGWADQNETITIDFKGKSYQTVADSSGEWQLMLPEQKAGGPYEMQIKGEKEAITLHNILIGDVWFASGQSNMELPMRRVAPIYEDEIKTSECPFIRHFSVPQRYNFKHPEKDLVYGSWVAANPETVLDFLLWLIFLPRRCMKNIRFR